MKKLLIFIGIVLATLTNTYAQTTKSSIFLGGNFNFTLTNRGSITPTTSYTNIGYTALVEAGGGYFLSSQLALGLQLGIGRGVAETTNTNLVTGQSFINKADGNTFSITPMLRYYHFLGEKVALIAQTSLGYQLGNRQILNTEKAHQVTAAFTPCIAYFVSPRSSFELMTNLVTANYSTYATSSTNQNDSFYFSLWNGVGSFAVAYRYYIRK